MGRMFSTSNFATHHVFSSHDFKSWLCSRIVEAAGNTVPRSEVMVLPDDRVIEPSRITILVGVRLEVVDAAALPVARAAYDKAELSLSPKRRPFVAVSVVLSRPLWIGIWPPRPVSTFRPGRSQGSSGGDLPRIP